MGVLYALSYWADLSQDSKVYRGISIALADSEFRQLLRPFSSCNGDVHGSGNTYGKSHVHGNSFEAPYGCSHVKGNNAVWMGMAYLMRACKIIPSRPVSNLSTLSKLLERLAVISLKPHICSSSNWNILQSAYSYSQGHSTETAL